MRVVMQVVATLTALGFFLIAAPLAQAQSGFVVEAGFGGEFRDGASVPVVVTITADRLIDGTLEVRTSGGFGRGITVGETVTTPVELAGGTTKQFLVVIPGVSSDFGSQLSVSLVENGEEIAAEENIRLRPVFGDELVGVFGDLSQDMPERVALMSVDASSRLFELTPAFLETYGAIDPLAAVVISTADFRALRDATQSQMLFWVHDGGTLLIVGQGAAEEVASISGKSTEKDTALPYGVGHLRAVSDAEGWQDALVPSEYTFNSGEGFGRELTGDTFFGGEPVSQTLAADSGFRLPSLPWMLGLLFAYLLIAGPLLWIVLRLRGSTMAIWIALPAVALLFTGAVWITGSSLRSGTDQAHATVLEITPAGARASTAHLLTSRSGGIESLALPSEWASTSSALPAFMFGPSSSGSTRTTRDGDSSTIRATLDAGDFAIAHAVGPMPQFDGALRVTAVSDVDGEVRGTVTNNLSVDLEEVGLFADQAGKNLGTIAAGETINFVLTGGARDPFRGEPIDFVVWRRPNNFGPFGPVPDADRAYAGSLWSEFVWKSGRSSRPIGQVVVAGFTRELPAPIDSDVDAGRTMVVTRAVIEPEGTVTDLTVARELIRGPGQTPDGENFDSFDGPPIFGATWRFTAPAQAGAGTPLQLKLPRSTEELQLYINGEWREVALGETVPSSLALEPEWFDSGSLTVRLYFSARNGPAVPPRSFVITGVDSDDQPSEVEFTEDEKTEDEEAA